MPLLSCPNEILLQIGLELEPDEKSLGRLLRTNRRFYSIFIGLLEGLAFRDKDGETPLIWAVKKGHVPLVLLLLKGGVDINLREILRDRVSRPPSNTKKEKSALEWAAALGNKLMVETLLANGASINLKWCNSLSALHWAADRGHTDVVRLLLEKGAPIDLLEHNEWTALHCAVGSGNRDTVRLLLEKGANVNLHNSLFLSPVQSAVTQGNKDMVQLLIEYGADLSGGRILRSAVIQMDHDMINLLLENGADINACNGHNISMPVLCHIALYWRSLPDPCSVIKLLISKGADISLTGVHGRTPLELALMARGSGPGPYLAPEAAVGEVCKLLQQKKGMNELLIPPRRDRRWGARWR